MSKQATTLTFLLMSMTCAAGCSTHLNMYTPGGANSSAASLKEGHGVIVFVCHTRNFVQPSVPVLIMPRFHKNHAALPYGLYCAERQVYQNLHRSDHCEAWQIFTLQVPAGRYNLHGYCVETNVALREGNVLTGAIWAGASSDFDVSPGQYVYVGRLELDALKSGAGAVSKFLRGRYGPVKKSWGRYPEEDLAFIHGQIPAMKEVRVVDADITVKIEPLSDAIEE